MARKPKIIDFEAENRQWLDWIRDQIGREVPLSSAYTRGQKPILVSIDAERATLRFPNGAMLLNVPLRDLVDDAGYWKN